ncbi:MAG: alpha/beta hydrolase [Actinomycetota bacterium]
MRLHTRRFGNLSAPPLICIAGFGDHGGMFEPLGSTPLGERYTVVGVDLPGTGHSPPSAAPLTLDRAATLVATEICDADASIVVGHSVGSIVASLAAGQLDNRVTSLISLEGNLTLADAYFSGSAADYAAPARFHSEFLTRLDAIADGDAAVRRYREQVATADPRSIWELGCDVSQWSRIHDPGAVLTQSAPHVSYLFNPDNIPAESSEWMRRNEIAAIQLDNASHWASVDQPDLVAKVMLDALSV